MRIVAIMLVSLMLGMAGTSAGVDSCLTGAFLADRPTARDIQAFGRAFGKRPYLMLVFVEWEAFVDPEVIRTVYGAGSALLVTWEPWRFRDKGGIDFRGLLAGRYDAYIRTFAERLKDSDGPIYLRFAHEMNGDWYPWSAAKIGSELYRSVYRHVKDVCDAAGAGNIRWVYAVNWEDVPAGNDWRESYPGDAYVDWIGIDGYNWGASQTWSRWMTFPEIFQKRYDEVAAWTEKPLMISEFGSSSDGGDKAAWIDEAFASLEKMPRIRAFALFNVDKETDWRVAPGTPAGNALAGRLARPYFVDEREGEKHE